MAFFKGSRYENLDVFDANSDGSSPFKGIKPRPVTTPAAVLEHTVSARERFDSLGQNYYAAPRLWYRIAEANPDVLFPEDLLVQDDPDPTSERLQKQRLGEVLLIPQARER